VLAGLWMASDRSPELLGLLGGATAPASGQELVGIATVIDGDTVEIHGRRVRLHGIDAPESAQLCTRPDGSRWRCGQASALALADRIGRHQITCRQTDTDHYGRIIAICRQAGADLNGWLVEQGLAVAYRRYSLDYARAEDRARRAQRGIWGTTFDMPWDWRRAQ
jgi:endonuclease YncB( thermonuclease family)